MNIKLIGITQTDKVITQCDNTKADVCYNCVYWDYCNFKKKEPVFTELKKSIKNAIQTLKKCTKKNVPL